MGQPAVIHDFQDCLSFSHTVDENPCWEVIYRTAFPTMQAMINHRQDGDHQRAGIDRSIILRNSKQLLIDEKARRIKDTGDIMLEYVSNDQKNTPGWAEKDLLADYICYAFIPSGTAYLLPVPQMQASWTAHKTEWIQTYGTRAAVNENYKTLSCPVPTPVLFKSIGSMLRVKF